MHIDYWKWGSIDKDTFKNEFSQWVFINRQTLERGASEDLLSTILPQDESLGDTADLKDNKIFEEKIQALCDDVLDALFSNADDDDLLARLEETKEYARHVLHAKLKEYKLDTLDLPLREAFIDEFADFLGMDLATVCEDEVASEDFTQLSQSIQRGYLQDVLDLTIPGILEKYKAKEQNKFWTITLN